MQRILMIIGVASVVAACNEDRLSQNEVPDMQPANQPDAHENLPDLTSMGDLTEPPLVDMQPAERLMWLLTNDHMGSGTIYVYDETSRAVVKQFPVPANTTTSPHALAYDGHSLWLGGMGGNDGLAELDPMNGAVRSFRPGIRTEGLAIDSDGYWRIEEPYSKNAQLVHDRWDGTNIQTIEVPYIVAQDIAVDSQYVYYIVNDANDPLLRVDPKTGVSEVLNPMVVNGLAPYTLAYDGSNLAIVDFDTILLHVDPTNGQTLSQETLPDIGWITAIAFE